MGKFVAALAMTHNPRIYWSAEAAAPEDREYVYRNFGVLRDVLRAARPDALIVLANDHFDNFFLDNMPSFCVGIARVAEGPFWYEHEIQRIPEYRVPVHEDLAVDILRRGIEAGIDFAFTHEFRMDHAFCVPLSFVAPERDVPIVPIYTNVWAYPLPTPRRFYELGGVLRQVIESRPGNERVAVLASFNLSTEVGGPKMGWRDLAFDELALDLMRSGNVNRVLAELSIERLLAAGNSTTEYLNYVAMLGIVGERPPDFIEFKIVPGWGNCPAAAWTLERGRAH
jgi:protocatechuate 4,5-dioxygenase beta chain